MGTGAQQEKKETYELRGLPPPPSCCLEGGWLHREGSTLFSCEKNWKIWRHVLRVMEY